MPWDAPIPPRPPSHPVGLTEVGRENRAVLGNLGQLCRHDLSEAYGTVPNADGTFNDRMLDRFRSGDDPRHRSWLITAAGRVGGYVMVAPAPGGGMSIAGFFVVRALRRSGVGRQAALQAIALFPGRWNIGFQRYNPGAEKFWSAVATETAGDNWEMTDGPTPQDRPPDTFITFYTAR